MKIQKSLFQALANWTTLPSQPPSLAMTQSTSPSRAQKPLPNPSMITDLTPLIFTLTTISDTMRVEFSRITHVLLIKLTMLSSMLATILLRGTGLFATLGVRIGVMLVISRWLWARILVMLKVMLGYLKCK